MQTLNQPGLWGLLFIVLFLAAVISCGVWALTRKAKVSAITSKHPYRRQRTVLVAVERRKGSRAPALTRAQAAQMAAEWRERHPQIPKAWRDSGVMS